MLELKNGEYVFECEVTDPYGHKTVVQKDVVISKEPNNDPEVYISGNANPGGTALVDFLAKKDKLAEEAKKEAK